MVQKPWGISLQKSSMPEAEDNANLLENAKRLLAAPPQTPITSASAVDEIRWIASSGSIMEPKTRPVFFSGSMVKPEMRPETEPDWLHYEAKVALSWSHKRGQHFYLAPL